MPNRNAREELDRLPSGLSKPALRALTGAGYTRLEQLAELTEADLRELHGMGTKAIDQIRQALAANGLSLGSQEQSEGA
jgi:DNA-directed RNA polymerase alpha subunit